MATVAINGLERISRAVGSMAGIVAVTTRPTSAAEVNDVFLEEAGGDR